MSPGTTRRSRKMSREAPTREGMNSRRRRMTYLCIVAAPRSAHDCSRAYNSLLADVPGSLLHLSTMSDADDLARATELWREAYGRQMQGDLEAAIDLYRRSLAVRPTAEAHTFLGWTLSFQGRLDEARQECLKAIEVDPDFGNPYNDIGVYLMQQDKLDEAIPWLEKAKRAP